MTTTISAQAYEELWQEANPTLQQPNSLNYSDITLKYPPQLGQGFQREIHLHEGIELKIDDYQLHSDLTTYIEEHDHPIQYGFCLAGSFRSRDDEVSPGQYWFCGSGLASGGNFERSRGQYLQINVHIAPELCQSLIGSAGQIASELLHLFREPHQEYQYRHSKVTPVMRLALQQILHCPYQGVTRQIYLESKVLELLALMVEQEIEFQRGKTPTASLNKDDLERIYQAQKILLQQLDHPPSLIDLARQVGLNDYALKRGFQQVFGKTVFGYLHDYRLEQAQQLLATSEMKVTEVADAIGFESRSYFASTFRKKFGVSPKAYQMQCKIH
jgi:AraC-like DNA-binding protein